MSLLTPTQVRRLARVYALAILSERVVSSQGLAAWCKHLLREQLEHDFTDALENLTLPEETT